MCSHILGGMTMFIKSKYHVRRDLAVYCSVCGVHIKPNDTLAHLEPYNDRKSFWQFDIVMDEQDDEGMSWRSFCKPCFDKISNLDAETIYNKYPASKYEPYDDDQGYGTLCYFQSR